MFYTEVVLGRKGPLARVWLAAHSDKKLTKAQVIETNIRESIEAILSNRYNLALRTSSHLLVGIVRIYDRKLSYILADCRDSLDRIRRSLQPPVMEKKSTGNAAKAQRAVTLPDDFYDYDEDDFEIPILPTEEIPVFGAIGGIDLDDDSTAITLREEAPSHNALEELMRPEFGDPTDLDRFLEANQSKDPEVSNMGGNDDITFTKETIEEPGLDENLDGIEPELEPEPELQSQDDVRESDPEHVDLESMSPPPPKKRRADPENNPQPRMRHLLDNDLEIHRDSYRAWLADTSDLVDPVLQPRPSRAHFFRREEWPREDVLSCGLFDLVSKDGKPLSPRSQPHENENSFDINEEEEEEVILAPVYEEDETLLPQSPDPIIDNNDDPEDEPEVDETAGNEERWTKRTEKMVQSLRMKMGDGANLNVSFLGLVGNQSRAQIAAKFYSLLVLSRDKVVTLEQKEAYGDIAVGKGEGFDNY